MKCEEADRTDWPCVVDPAGAMWESRALYLQGAHREDLWKRGSRGVEEAGKRLGSRKEGERRKKRWRKERGGERCLVRNEPQILLIAYLSMARRVLGEGPPFTALHLWVPLGYIWAGCWAGILFRELPSHSEPSRHESGADQLLLFLASANPESLLPSRRTKVQCFCELGMGKGKAQVTGAREREGNFARAYGLS